MINDRITDMLSRAVDSSRVFPPTDLFNEGWMLRLTLDWLSRRDNLAHDLAFSSGSAWYSEALLPSAFLPRHRGDKLAESWTHADGVIGEFIIGENGVGDLSVTSGVSQLLVTEAKMYSKLSTGVTNARYFDQAARNVACIAEVLKRAEVDPHSVSSLGFFVIAPQSQIEMGGFSSQMNLDGMREIVSRRVSEYEDESRQEWFENWFVPVSHNIKIRCVAWEEVLEIVNLMDPEFGKELGGFYSKCLEFNRVERKRLFV